MPRENGYDWRDDATRMQRDQREREQRAAANVAAWKAAEKAKSDQLEQRDLAYGYAAVVFLSIVAVLLGYAWIVTTRNEGIREDRKAAREAVTQPYYAAHRVWDECQRNQSPYKGTLVPKAQRVLRICGAEPQFPQEQLDQLPTEYDPID